MREGAATSAWRVATPASDLPRLHQASSSEDLPPGVVRALLHRIGGMEYIDLRKVGKDGLREIRRQVVRLKKLGKTGKEIEELTGVRQNRVSEIWTAYQREGESSLERKKYGRKPGSHMVLTEEEQEKIRKAVEENIPEDFGITGKLWTLGRTREYIEKEYQKAINERTLWDYMKRWGMSCQRPAKRARKQNPQGI